MKPSPAIVVVVALLGIAACKKKAADAPAATPAAATPAASSAPVASSGAPADSTEAQRDMAKKQALMDYAAMEDHYMNDAAAQWASSAKASSTFGDDGGKVPTDGNLAANVVGAVDGKTWTNNKQDIGFDWLEATFAKPVSATEVRVVFSNGEGVEAVNKVELQDAAGAWNTVWSGISDQKAESRGNRTWFVRSFAKTAYQVKAVRITIANNVQRGYKVVDAVQLVGS